MSYPSWIPPEEKDIQANKTVEPRGERIRAELIELLERNKICSILMDTPHHHVSIDWGPNLPNETKSVLTLWGAIRVVVERDAKGFEK